MRRVVSLALLVLLLSLGAWAQEGVPMGFGYQALVFEGGKPAKDRAVELKIYLQDAGGEVFYSEQHAGLKTTASGVVSVTVGAGQGLTGSMAAVPWDRGIWIASQADLGSGFVSLGGPVKLQSVPYALFALAAPRVQGTAAGAQADAPIFEVKDSKGAQVFGVYESGVRMLVTDDASLPEGTVSGFVLSSRSLGADGVEEERERLRVGDGGVRFYVDEELRGVRGGFAVATRRAAGEEAVPRLGLAQHSAMLTIDDMEGRGVRGGFAVATRLGLRGEGARVDRLSVEDGGVRFLVDPVQRGVRGGFAVATRMALRGQETLDLFVLNNSQTYFTVRPGASTGFSFRDRQDTRRALMNVTGEGKIVTKSADARKVLKPVVDESIENLRVVLHPEVTGGVPTFSNVDRWMGVGLGFSLSSSGQKTETDVSISLPEGVPLEVVKLRQLDEQDDLDWWGVKYTGQHSGAATELAVDMKVCMRNFPDKCATLPDVRFNLEPNYLDRTFFSNEGWIGVVEDGQLKMDRDSPLVWHMDALYWHKLFASNAKLEFTSSVEGFAGVIEGGRFICTNRDPEWLRNMKGKAFSNITITVKGEMVDPALGSLTVELSGLVVRD